MQGSQHDSGRSIGAIVLIAVGVVFLFGQIFSVDIFDWFGRFFNLDWPFFILLPGFLLLAIAFLGGRGAAPFAFPGAVVAGTGLILFYQNATNHFESWSYLWGLYPVFVGLAMMFVGARTGNPNMVRDGRKAVTVGLILTAVFGLFMETIFSGNLDLLFRYIVPLALIGGGALLLLRGRRHHVYAPVEKPKNEPFPPPAPEGKPKNDYGIDPTLERQIKDALADDDRQDPRALL